MLLGEPSKDSLKYSNYYSDRYKMPNANSSGDISFKLHFRTSFSTMLVCHTSVRYSAESHERTHLQGELLFISSVLLQ